MSRRQVLVWYYKRSPLKRPLAGLSIHTHDQQRTPFCQGFPRKQHAPSKPALTLERLSVVVIRNSLFFYFHICIKSCDVFGLVKEKPQ